VTRSLVLLRKHRLALLTLLVEDRSSLPPFVAMRVSLPRAITTAPIERSRAILLSELKKPGSALVLPIGLPSLPYPTERGEFRANDDGIVLHHASSGPRCWLPLLVSWDGARHRKAVCWRVLTVSERSRIVRPDVAFAARVSWGRHETYVIYRSFTAPAPRAFLGHQTKARFLVGSFLKDGTVKPIIQVDK
jgi:hypothetical protein